MHRICPYTSRSYRSQPMKGIRDDIHVMWYISADKQEAVSPNLLVHVWGLLKHFPDN